MKSCDLPFAYSTPKTHPSDHPATTQRPLSETDIMAASIVNDTEFITELTLPFIYFKTRPFLKFYLTKGVRFGAHQNLSLVKKWYTEICEASKVQDIEGVCNEMYNIMFTTQDHHILFHHVFNNGIRDLFGGMFGINRDYWDEMGVDLSMAFSYYYCQPVPAIQRFQLLMCWELFWGVYGYDQQKRMSNYKQMYDDLYATISMSEFTPYYLGAIKYCIEEKPNRFVNTIVNIIMHAFKYIKNARKAKRISNDPTIHEPLWRDWYSAKVGSDPLYFVRSIDELIIHVDDEEEMDALVPSCLKEVI